MHNKKQGRSGKEEQNAVKAKSKGAVYPHAKGNRVLRWMD